MSELKACPFCSETPELPDGYGTQYEIQCGCGMAVSSVQICDLMTLEERTSDSFADFKYQDKFVDRAKHAAIEQWNTRALPEGYVLELVEHLKAAKYRIESGRVWSGMGWTLTGLNPLAQQQALEAINAAMLVAAQEVE